MENKSKTAKKEISLPQTSAAALMGKQSVRATFRLSAECIHAISILSAQMGIKQKSVFDHLMEDANSLASIAREAESVMLNKEGRTAQNLGQGRLVPYRGRGRKTEKAPDFLLGLKFFYYFSAFNETGNVS